MRMPDIARLRVEIDDVTPAVIRRVEVPLTIRLDDLHFVLQIAIGWQNCHPFEFRVGDSAADADALNGKIWGLLDRDTERQVAEAEVLRLRTKTPNIQQKVVKLSGGNQQKVVLGKWLLTKPRVLFLDEPTRGVDVGAKAEIHRLIAELAEAGLGVVLVSSDLPELLGMSHRVLVLSLGAATAELSASEATPEAVMTAATMKV